MEHHVEYSCQGRYYSLGNQASPSRIWFVLHGYGQLASFFIRKFSILEEHNILIIAPEAPSRFYLHDTEQRMQISDTRVGASWMTREDRLTDIRNYVKFLNAVYFALKPPLTAPVNILGFSQGAATATRWLLDGKVNFSRLILWAGVLPLDIDFSTGKEIFKGKETFLVYGKNDPLLNDSMFAEMSFLSKKMGISPRRIEFEGEHNIDSKTLLTLI